MGYSTFYNILIFYCMKTNTYSVLGIGIATMDYLLTVPAYPAKDTKIHCTSWIKQGGGNCANTLVALSRLGMNTHMYTCIGKDSVGNEIKKSLETEGVSTDYIIESGDTSPLSVVIVGSEDNSRTIIHRQGAHYRYPLPLDKTILQNKDLLFCDGRFAPAALPYAIEAREQNIPVFVEAEKHEADIEKLIPYGDILVISRDYYNEVFGDKNFQLNLARLQNKGPGIIILTLGEQGSLCYTGKTLIQQKSHETKVVDTTGAGDAFNAGFIFGIVHKWSIDKCLNFASRIAAIKCTKPGARSGLPYTDDVRFMYDGL